MEEREHSPVHRRLRFPYMLIGESGVSGEMNEGGQICPRWAVFDGFSGFERYFAFKKRTLRECLQGKLDTKKPKLPHKHKVRIFMVQGRIFYKKRQISGKWMRGTGGGQICPLWLSWEEFQVSDLKPIRKALLEKEVLTVVSPAEMAQAYCDAVNRKQFSHNMRVKKGREKGP